MPGVSWRRRGGSRVEAAILLGPGANEKEITMSHTISGVVLFAMIGAATIAACAPKTGQHDPAADEGALASTASNWEKAYNEKNADGVAAVYSEDAQLLPPGPAVVTGRAAIRDYWANDIVASNSTFAISADATGVGGDWAWRSGSWRGTAANGAELNREIHRGLAQNQRRMGNAPRHLECR